MSRSATVPAGTDPSSEVPPTAGVIPGRRVLVLILVLVNSGAIWGQTGWGIAHIVPAGWWWVAGLVLALAFAASLELIGVFLAHMADLAEDRGIPAGGIRLGSYLVGLFIGLLNFSHFLGLSLAAAIAFAFLSSISPFLWGIYARVRRGLPVAPSRRFWHPIRSIKLIRFAAWEGIIDEDQARISYEFSRNSGEDTAPVSGGGGRTRREIGMEAFRMRSEEPRKSWEKIAAELGVTPSYLFQCRKEAEVS